MAEEADFAEIVSAVEAKYDADVYLYSAAIDQGGFGHLVSAVAKKKAYSKRKNGLLILTTNGGLANSAYQIARLLQQTYDRFLLFSPRQCKSAGTIVALGAHAIIMDVFSELGPLDVQLLDKDEIGARKSGLLTRSAFESLSTEAFELFSKNMLGIKAASGNLISFKLAADISWRLTAELLSPIFAQLNPDVIGSDFRDLSVAMAYGERLTRISKNAKADAVHRLVTDYPSHDFIIDREEAATLFEKVDQPSEELYELVAVVREAIYRQANPGIVMALPPERRSENEESEAGEKDATDEGAAGGAEVAKGRRRDRRSDRRPKERGSDSSSGTSDSDAADAAKADGNRSPSA